MENKIINHKSEILFLFEAKYNVPNGDPFTGEQRYDEETKKILVSDVRMKRYVRDYLDSKGENIYVTGDKALAEAGKDGGSGSAARVNYLEKNTFKDELQEAEKLSKDKKGKFNSALFVMKKCIDVRLFGGIATGKGNTGNLTGAVQFSLLNPSLNRVNLRMHQNTSVFTSSTEKSQGAIGTTTIVPYSINQIHGWLNPKVAEQTEMNEQDLKLLFEGLWYGTSGDGSSHSRSKIGQDSLLLLEVVYSESNKKLYGIDQLVKLTKSKDKEDEQLRSMEDFDFDFTKLIEASSSDKVAKIKYYTEIKSIKEKFSSIEKFEEMTF